MRRIFTIGDGHGAKEESDAKPHLRARDMTPFKALGVSRGPSRQCLAPPIRAKWPLSPYRTEPVTAYSVGVPLSAATLVGRAARAPCPS